MLSADEISPMREQTRSRCAKAQYRQRGQRDVDKLHIGNNLKSFSRTEVVNAEERVEREEIGYLFFGHPLKLATCQ